jgi:hypothetical protein
MDRVDQPVPVVRKALQNNLDGVGSHVDQFDNRQPAP